MNQITPLKLCTELHRVVVSDLLDPASGEDFKLGHDSHEKDFSGGVRFMVSESARREVLSRLLGLNHERWEEEQKALESVESVKGVKSGKSGKVRKPKSTDGQIGLL